MQRFILIRCFYALIVLFIVSLIVFGLARLSGNPVDVFLPADAGPAQERALERSLGLDQPLPIQYLKFVGNAMRGDFGQSINWADQTAIGLVIQRFPATLQLAAIAIGISILIAVPVGVLSAVKKDSIFDYIGKVIALAGQSLPPFWLGIVLIFLFAVQLDLFPTSGRGGGKNLILPAITLGWFQVAAMMRLVRSAMLEVLDTEYIKLARIKGIVELKVVWKHALKNAAIPPLTFFGIVAGQLMTGAVITESVFTYPGTGLLAIQAINARDYPVVQAVVITFAGIYILANLVVDVLYAYLDPRIRY
ncbi:MAG: ABC transporter permease [Chloroflexota bacterium]|nr:ABC transporter permease [Chloroflexota bacterium]